MKEAEEGSAGERRMWRQLMGRERGRRDGLVGEEKRKMPERNEREGGRQLGSQTW